MSAVPFNDLIREKQEARDAGVRTHTEEGEKATGNPKHVGLSLHSKDIMLAW